MSMNTASYADLLVMLSAKDGEIAQLRRQLESWREAEFAAVNKGEAIMRERDEARECVGRLCVFARKSLENPSGDGWRTLLTVTEQLERLAATPEHLRR